MGVGTVEMCKKKTLNLLVYEGRAKLMTIVPVPWACDVLYFCSHIKMY